MLQRSPEPSGKQSMTLGKKCLKETEYWGESSGEEAKGTVDFVFVFEDGSHMQGGYREGCAVSRFPARATQDMCF